MKKFWLRTAAVFVAVCMLIGMSVVAYAGERLDIVLNSGDVVEEEQYYTKNDYDPTDYKCVNSVVFNAYGSEPIIVKRYAFAGFDVGDNVWSITFNGTGEIRLGSDAFRQTQITDLYIPSNVVFDEGATYVFGNSTLKTVKIGGSLCNSIFSDCSYLENVSFSDDINIEVIPKGAFDYCSSLKTFKVPESVVKIDDYAFSFSGLNSIELNEGLESIGENSFSGLFGFGYIKFPSTLKSIGNKCFEYGDLKNVVLNQGLEKIGEYAFRDCNRLKSVVIPSSVTEIGTQAFGYDSLEKIDGFTIYGYSGTAAETYAKKNGFTFIPLEDNVTDVTYTPSWSSVNDYVFTVSGRADKLQVIEANGGTRTVTRNSPSVVIKSYDINGNEVSSLSRELDYEVWTVNTRLTPDTELQVHAKYNNEWVDATYRFSVSTLYSDKTLKKAELSSTSGGQGMVDCNIVTGSGVSKVRVEYEDGMTSTYNSGYATLDVENMTYTYDISVKAYRIGEIPYKIYIKTPSGWQYATTLTYTAE